MSYQDRLTWSLADLASMRVEPPVALSSGTAAWDARRDHAALPAHEHFMVTGRVASGMRPGVTVKTTIGPFHSQAEVRAEIERQGVKSAKPTYYPPGTLTHDEPPVQLSSGTEAWDARREAATKMNHGELDQHMLDQHARNTYGKPNISTLHTHAADHDAGTQTHSHTDYRAAYRKALIDRLYHPAPKQILGFSSGTAAWDARRVPQGRPGPAETTSGGIPVAKMSGEIRSQADFEVPMGMRQTPEEEHPERYEPAKGYGVQLKDGETETHTRADPNGEPVQFQVQPMIGSIDDNAGHSIIPNVGPRGLGTEVPGSEEPRPYTFRTMSEAEFQGAVKNGYIQSNGSMDLDGREGTVTSDHSTGSFYMQPGDNRIVRIRITPDLGFKVDPVDEYLKTPNRIPMSSVDLVSPRLTFAAVPIPGHDGNPPSGATVHTVTINHDPPAPLTAAERLLLYSPDQLRVPAGGPGGGQFGGGGGGGGTGPSANETLVQRRTRLTAVLTAHGSALTGPDSTAGKYKDPITGKWDAARQAQQDKIIATFVTKAAGVPRDRQAIIVGGLPGSGKSTALASDAMTGLGVDTKNDYATVSPDDFKAAMAAAGMVPTVGDMSPMEGTTWVHEEASAMALRYSDILTGQGTNLIWDITLSGPNSGFAREAPLRAAGYDVSGVYVDADPATAAAGVVSRYQNQQQKYLDGEPGALGGRMGGGYPTAAMGSGGRPANLTTFQAMAEGNGTNPPLAGWVVFNRDKTGLSVVASGGRWASMEAVK